MEIDRYHRQRLLPQIGEHGQQRIAVARVLLIGCGALGSVIADQLVRAGIGFLRIVDRDLVEWTNLQRQVLFDEADARNATPKAIAAAERLRAVNSQVIVDGQACDVDSDSIEQLMRLNGRLVDVVLDGTDNVQTRYLINDASVKHGVPWVYGACIGVEGRVMSILPQKTACLRCIFSKPPSPGEMPTCDTDGVLAPVAAIVASLQVVAAMKLLLGHGAGELIRVDGFLPEFHLTDTSGARRDECPACGKRRFEFLESSSGRDNAKLCGRNAVQVRPPSRINLSLEQLASRLKSVARVTRTPHLVRFNPPEHEHLQFSVFPDGRAIVQGTSDVARARSLYARFVGA